MKHAAIVAVARTRTWRGGLRGSASTVQSDLFDPSIGVFDGVLSDALCDAIVRLFDGPGASEHYTGNVGAGTGFEVKPESKLDTEIDISHSQRPLWDGVEFALVQALLGALDGYAASNPGLATPFSWTDEGFRLKRYSATSDSDGGGGRRRANSGEAAVGGEALGADLPHHHAWHADAGSAGELGCRGIAAIFYFNDVTSGGETVFMSPRPAAVAPRKGRLLLFPASFAYYHAGAEPRSHHKYIATTFASACDLPKSGHFQPLPLLPVARRHVLRATFGMAPPGRLNVTAEQIAAWAGEAFEWPAVEAARRVPSEEVSDGTTIRKVVRRAGRERRGRKCRSRMSTARPTSQRWPLTAARRGIVQMPGPPRPRRSAACNSCARRRRHWRSCSRHAIAHRRACS